MKNRDTGDGFDDEEPGWDSSEPPEELDATGETEVECPYCGELVEITLDSAGGASQDYVEDCEVCCRPWQVHVRYGVGGSVEVRVEQA